MSYKVSLNIHNNLEKNFFFAIRKKVHFIKLLLNTLKFFISTNIDQNQSNDSNYKVILQVEEKMSRFIFTGSNKHFSIICPFKVKEIQYDEGRSCSFYFNDLEISLHFISKVNILLERNSFGKNFIDFMDDIFKELISTDEEYWSLLNFIIFLESGYLRFDHDPTNQNGNLHPLNHFDIYYTEENTFKIGLNSIINSTQMLDILNNNCIRKYLH